jgi:hypothetical protein
VLFELGRLSDQRSARTAQLPPLRKVALEAVHGAIVDLINKISEISSHCVAVDSHVGVTRGVHCA